MRCGTVAVQPERVEALHRLVAIPKADTDFLPTSFPLSRKHPRYLTDPESFIESLSTAWSHLQDFNNSGWSPPCAASRALHSCQVRYREPSGYLHHVALRIASCHHRRRRTGNYLWFWISINLTPSKRAHRTHTHGNKRKHMGFVQVMKQI